VSENGHGNRFGARPTPAELQAMMRQTAPLPTPPPDVDNWRLLQCSCGSTQYAAESVTLIKVNPLRAWEYAPGQVSRAKCMKCGKYPQLVDGDWAFMDTPPEITES
jgi:hypothetical protein